MKTTIDTQRYTREVTLAARAIENSREVELSWSSEEPYVRNYYLDGEMIEAREVLDHADGSADLSILREVGGLFLDHSTARARKLATIVDVGIRDRRGYARVRFLKSQLAEELYQSILAGERESTSVGYIVREMRYEPKGEGELPVMRVIDWQPYEISIVGVPADPTVGVGRQAEFAETITTVLHREDMEQTMKTEEKTETRQAEALAPEPKVETRQAEPKPAPSIDVPASERNRATEILDLGRKFERMEQAVEAVRAGTPSADFQRQLLEAMAPKPVTAPPAGRIDASARDIRRYSILRAICRRAAGMPLDGVEGEMHRECERVYGRSSGGVLIPDEVLRRDLNTSDDSDIVAAQQRPQDFIGILRNRMLVGSLGARMLSGLTGNQSIPRQTGSATASWETETSSKTADDQTFDDIDLTPHRVTGATAFTRTMLHQTSLDIEQLVRDDLAAVIALAIDYAALQGSGANNQPTGLVTAAVAAGQTVTFGGAPTWAKVVEFEETVDTGNAMVDNVAYVTTPGVKGAWKTTAKESGYPLYLIDADGRCNTHRFESTNQVASNKVIFGNFADLLIAMWAGLEVIVDPYTLAATDKIKITTVTYADIGVRRTASFAVSTDAGNQSGS